MGSLESLAAEYERVFASWSAPEVRAFELATRALVTYGRAYYTRSPRKIDSYRYEPLETGLLAAAEPIETAYGHTVQAFRVYVNEDPPRTVTHPTLLDDIRDVQAGQADPAEVAATLRDTIKSVTCETYLLASNPRDLLITPGVADFDAYTGEFLEVRAPDAMPQPPPPDCPDNWAITVPDYTTIEQALQDTPDLRLYGTPLEPTLTMGYKIIYKHRRPRLDWITEEDSYRYVAQEYLQELEKSYGTYEQLVQILTDPLGRVASLEVFRPAPPADANR